MDTAMSAGPAVVEISNLSKSFQRRDGATITPVDNISLEVHAGEFVVLLGPSGCGKTTLLRCVAGLEQPDRGRIDIGGSTVFSSDRGVLTPPERRSVSVVFQSYALWPHMTVFKNVAYPLRRRRLNAATVTAQVSHVLDLVGVGHLAQQYPGQLSGGQQQRVALARALVAGNDLVLFDEPLSNVDAKVRDQLRGDLLEMQQELRFAALYVTHDQTEAMELGHRIATLRDGVVEQLASPREIYLQPANRYVANFVGRTNEFDGPVTRIDGDTIEFKSALGPMLGVSTRTFETGSHVLGVVRPESIRISDEQPAAGQNRHSGTVSSVVFGGAQVRIHIELDGDTVEVWRPSDTPTPDLGATVWVGFDPANCWLMDGSEFAPVTGQDGR
ncbi:MULTISPECIES: ATP-binding cassette domain-containing protein [unclassified Rhodococcus (in: high G+C Gram-positive bacteria)]|uniref:ABC transporter ATP-binding protein n=1 Tax=Rhodococcus sp. SJ-3 TaxID=3454628 RepID=UPI003F7A61BE